MREMKNVYRILARKSDNFEYMGLGWTVILILKLPLCVIKYHVMKTYGLMEILFHAFLTIALHGTDC
jgi:hypothetical protein